VAFATQIDGTRGTPISNAADLTSMGVFCAATGADDWSATATSNKMFNEQLNNTSGTWTYVGADVYWGADNFTDRYTFFAYTPYASTNNGITVNGSATAQGKTVLSYSVPTNIVQQPDLMLAVPRYNILPTGAAVALQMKHALTCVGFQIAGDGEQITGISISGVSVSGDVVMDGSNIVWSNLGNATTTDFSTSLNYDAGEDYFTVPKNMSTNLIAADGYLMMLPQTRGSNAKIKLSFKDGSTKEINLNDYTWEAGKHVTYNITLVPTGTVIVTPENVFLHYTAQTPANKTLKVKCMKNDGSDDPNANWTLSVPANNWLRLSLNGNTSFAGASTTVTGTGNQTVYIYATQNGEGFLRNLDFYMNDISVGNIAQEWDLYSKPGKNTTPNAVSYVGAFWRNDQIGERLIQIDMGNETANYGTWRAAVVWMDDRWNEDDIVLALGSSPNLSLDAEDNLVTGDATIVKGTVSATERVIAFRIGLKSKYEPTPNYPARYAVVILFYNDCTKLQKIFLRQGENADYIMRPTDPYPGSEFPREHAAKFSPYNLTAKNNLNGGPYLSGHPKLAKNDGKFVEYPTQAGAFFTWSGGKLETDTKLRRAYHPVNPVGQFADFEWPGNYPEYHGERFWQALYETCPPGYHRPNDSYTGSNSQGTAQGSEIRQSLFTNKLTGYGVSSTYFAYNSLYGYYADGYFDRNPKETSVTGEVNSAVNKDSKDVAYKGYLLYNPETNASIFFPVAGFRDGTDSNARGKLQAAGNTAYYWTTTDTHNNLNSQIASSLYLRTVGNSTTMSMDSKIRTMGFNIRCVKD
jgi:hypothetical protein